MLAARTILHPTDFSEQAKHAFCLARALAQEYGARLILLHVIPRRTVMTGQGIALPPDPEDLCAAGEAQLAKLQAFRAERRVVEGEPADEILHAAEEVHAELIVLGCHGRTGLTRLLMGSVAEQVVRKATCPVLTVKAPCPASVVKQQQPAQAEMSEVTI